MILGLSNPATPDSLWYLGHSYNGVVNAVDYMIETSAPSLVEENV